MTAPDRTVIDVHREALTRILALVADLTEARGATHHRQELRAIGRLLRGEPDPAAPEPTPPPEAERHVGDVTPRSAVWPHPDAGPAGELPAQWPAGKRA